MDFWSGPADRNILEQYFRHSCIWGAAIVKDILKNSVGPVLFLFPGVIVFFGLERTGWNCLAI